MCRALMGMYSYVLRVILKCKVEKTMFGVCFQSYRIRKYLSHLVPFYVTS